MNKEQKENLGKHLGAKSEYIDQYDPTLLVREPRQRNRNRLGITSETLPFVGIDSWHGYEVTALTDTGLPVNMLVKFVYSAESEYIVESKSVKLYFGSFAMTNMGSNPSLVAKHLKWTAKSDLSDLLETDVEVIVYNTTDSWSIDRTALIPTVRSENLEKLLELNIIGNGEDDVFDTYSENTDLLKIKETTELSQIYNFHSGLLRSRCLITSQPDSGDIFITYKGKNKIDPLSLLKYIVSFRNECHFHEEVCEAIYVALNNILKPEQLGVTCQYARRGSWDINPARASSKELLNTYLTDTMYRTIRQ